MIRILIIEDNEAKMRSIREVIASVPGSAVIDINDADCVAEAKRRMLHTHYDLVILDVRLPHLRGQNATADAGVALANQVSQGGRFKCPKNIIAVTAFDDTQQETAAAFAERSVVVVKYDSSSDGWQKPIRNKIEQLLEENETKGIQYDFDFAIITALKDPELDAVLRLPYAWSNRYIGSDAFPYFEGAIANSANEKFRIVAASAPQMGMSAASVLSCRMIHEFRPKYLFMAGIAAGVRGAVEYGDILIADPSFDQNSGKVKMVSGEDIFQPDPLPLRIDPAVNGILRTLVGDSSALGAIRANWPGTKPNHVLSAHIGPMATGAAVLATTGALEETQTHWRKLIGLDLETYGVFYAGANFGTPKPYVVSAKSVTDYADTKKDDAWRGYAAHTSASFLDSVIRQIISLGLSR